MALAPTRKGVYHGPQTELLGKTAIVRDPGMDGVLAQFDFGKRMNEDCTGSRFNYLCFGWHGFRRSDFTLYPEPYD